MAFPDLPVPSDAPTLPIGGSLSLAMPADGSPLVVALDVPPWTRSFFVWSAPRRTVHVAGPVPTNAGIYGPDPTIISGATGKVAGPAVGVYKPAYDVGPRTLDTGRYYLVVRAKDGPAAAGRTVALTAR